MTEREEDFALDPKQVRRLNTIRRVLQHLAFRWLWFFLAALAACVALFTGAFAAHVARSWDRYEAACSLMFSPKQVNKFGAMDSSQVYHIFGKAALMEKFAAALDLSGVERMRARQDVTIERKRGENRIFGITARAKTAARAVEKANTFAELCIREYLAYRMEDLERWNATIGARRKELLSQMEEIDEEETRLAKKCAVSATQADVDRLHLTIAGQKTRLAEVEVKISNGSLRKKRLEAKLAGFDRSVLSHARELKSAVAEMLEKEKALAELRAQFTERNPRVLAAVRARDELKKTYSTYLSSLGVGEATPAELDTLAADSAELAEVSAKLEGDLETKEALKRQIARSEGQLAEIFEHMPDFDRLRRNRQMVLATIKDLESTVSDIRYLQASVDGDLTHVERAAGAAKTPAFGKRTIVLGTLCGFFLAFTLAGCCVGADFAWGFVRGEKELGFVRIIHRMGTITNAEAEAGEGETLACAFHRMENAKQNLARVFACVLPGGERVRAMREILDLHQAMAGKEVAHLSIVRAEKFAEPEGAELLSGAWMLGAQAWLPVEDPDNLTPIETRLFEQDMKALSEKFDIVVFSRDEPVRGGVFTNQMLKSATSTLMYVGETGTPRKIFRRVLRMADDLGIEPMVVVTGAKGPGRKGKGGVS